MEKASVLQTCPGAEEIYEHALQVLKLKKWSKVKAKLHDAAVIDALQAYLAGLHSRVHTQERPDLYQLHRNLMRRL